MRGATPAQQRTASRDRLRRIAARAVSALVGLTLLGVALIFGWSGLIQGLARAGWELLWLLPLQLAADSADSLGWHALLADQPKRPPRWYFVWGACLRDAAVSLLPVVGAAAPLIGVGWLAARGLRWVHAFASIVVEACASLISQPLFVLVALLAVLSRRPAADLAAVVLPLIAVSLATAGVALFLQRRRRPYRWAARALAHTLGQRLPLPPLALYRLYAGLHRIHRHPRALLGCVLWQLLGLAIGALELALLLALLGQPVQWDVVLLLQGLSRLTRSVAFALPAGLGAQEGAFALVGVASGLGAGIGLTLSLLLRCRDVLFGVPVLLSVLGHTDRWLIRGGAFAGWRRPDHA